MKTMMTATESSSPAFRLTIECMPGFADEPGELAKLLRDIAVHVEALGIHPTEAIKGKIKRKSGCVGRWHLAPVSPWP